jgi:anthranilate/para-aminobenzoate synthase component I
VHKNGRIRANAGGGVTTLSDPAAEYDETLHKLLGIERTLQRRAEAPS